MIWDKIKKALNSSIGTEGFKPLDKIIETGFDEVKQKQDEIKNTADSTLLKLQTGNNEFKVAFAESVSSFIAAEIEVIKPEDERKSQYADLPQKGLYMITLYDSETHDNFVGFVYYGGVTSSSYTYYLTPMKNYQGSVVNGRYNAPLGHDAKVYLINVVFD